MYLTYCIIIVIFLFLYSYLMFLGCIITTGVTKLTLARISSEKIFLLCC